MATATVDTLPSGIIHVRNHRSVGADPDFQLVEDLRIGRLDGDGPDVFGDIQDLAVDPQGYIGPRVIMRFPTDADQILLSGALDGAQALAGRAQVIDAPVGDGHVVSFSIRPFWRWQTQGTFFLGFNALLNWNDLDAGRAEPATEPVTSPGSGM